MEANSRVKALALASVLIMGYEGASLITYEDVVGVKTICYGHTSPSLKGGEVETEEGCLELLKEDLSVFDRAFDRVVTVPTTAPQRAAGISLMYNIGVGAFSSSTALRKLNSGDYEGYCAQYVRWVYAKGSFILGLLNRRTDERRVCEGKLTPKEIEVINSVD